MEENKNKTIPPASPDRESSYEEEFGYNTKTAEIDRSTYIGGISSKQLAFLEIIGSENDSRRIELGDSEVSIGRIPDCEVQLLVENVSRRHARILYLNEEYQIEDLGSKNGVYVNGIRVEKCILRKNDVIDIGGVKILFVERGSRLIDESK